MVAPRTPTVVVTPLRLKLRRTPGNRRTLRRSLTPIAYPPFGCLWALLGEMTLWWLCPGKTSSGGGAQAAHTKAPGRFRLRVL